MGVEPVYDRSVIPHGVAIVYRHRPVTTHCAQAMKDGVPDFSKGSFYINPVVDTFPNVDPELIKKYPTFFGDNIFPTEQIPAFEEAIKAASKLMMDVCAIFNPFSVRSIKRMEGLLTRYWSSTRAQNVHKLFGALFGAILFAQESREPDTSSSTLWLLIQVGVLVAGQCDAYVHAQEPAFAPDKCQAIVRDSQHHACRLLHYFAFADSTSIPQDLDSWCGWHNDHCTLTSLMPAMYHDAAGTPIPCPDKEAGLYIKSRNGQLVHVAYVRVVSATTSTVARCVLYSSETEVYVFGDAVLTR